jgi:hypothetical protein
LGHSRVEVTRQGGITPQWCGGGREQDSVERQTEHPGSVYQLTWVLVIESWKLS